MKIKFIAYWNTDYNIYSIINDIWNINGEFNDILTYNNDYTHIVVLNNASTPAISKENLFGIILEPNWSTGFDRNLFDKCNKVISYQPDFYNKENIIFSPLLGTHRLYPTNHIGEIIYVPNTTKTILETNFKKTKKLSIIMNFHHDSNHIKRIHNITRYEERQNLVFKLLESDIDFDLYGFNWDKYGIKDNRYKGPINNKIFGIQDYEYTISLENSSIKGNITEKIIDAILCKTVPIYNGHESIFEFYPNSCEYLEYDGNEIEKIKSIIHGDKKYYDFEGNIDRYLNVYNPIKIIKNTIEND